MGRTKVVGLWGWLVESASFCCTCSAGCFSLTCLKIRCFIPHHHALTCNSGYDVRCKSRNLQTAIDISEARRRARVLKNQLLIKKFNIQLLSRSYADIIYSHLSITQSVVLVF